MSFFNSFPRKIDTGESNFPRRMHYHVSKFPYNYKSLGKLLSLGKTLEQYVFPVKNFPSNISLPKSIGKLVARFHPRMEVRPKR